MKNLLPALSQVVLLSVFLGWGIAVVGQPAGPGQGSQTAAGPAGNNDALLLLLEQNRNLQTEVQALRGMVEEQGYEIRKLQRESLDRYTDIDSRLGLLEQPWASGIATPTQNQTPAPGIDRRVPPQSASVTAIDNADIQRYPDPFETGDRTRVAGDGANNPNLGNNATTTVPLARTTPSRPTLEPAVFSEQQLYQMAYESAINSQFERAVAEFDQYLSIYPSGRFVVNAHYWKGQSYRYLSRFDQSITSYNIILQQYTDSAKVPEAMFGLGVAYEELGNTQRARQLFQEIIGKYPNSGAANLADTRLLSLD